MILNMNGSSRKINNESVVHILLKKEMRTGLKYLVLLVEELKFFRLSNKILTIVV